MAVGAVSGALLVLHVGFSAALALAFVLVAGVAAVVRRISRGTEAAQWHGPPRTRASGRQRAPATSATPRRVAEGLVATGAPGGARPQNSGG